jgi:hypothetical protein
MKSQLTFTPEVLTCCTHYNHYYLTPMVIYERLNTFNYNLALNGHVLLEFPPGTARRGLAIPQSLVLL